MSVIQKPEHDRVEDRLDELEREERELERRTDGYQWNHAIALVASVVALVLALVAIVIAVNADNRTPVASGPTGMAGAMSAGAGAMSSAMSSAGSGAGAAASSAAPTKSIKLTMKPDAKRGSDGNTHDAVFPSADITVKAGQTVRLTIYNYDDMPHSFTSPGLPRGAAIPPTMQQMQGTAQDLKVMPAPGMGVNQTVPAGSDKRPSATVVTFTAPRTAGSYVWYCRLPCDPWAMAHYGYMRGHVIVTRA